jgi:hypothetical protein
MKHKMPSRARERERERGQTIVLVAISLISLLAVAALAIDVVTLYVARSEIQRAADAAALAAAKAIADSGYTTLPVTDPRYIDGSAQILAQSMSNAAIDAMHSATSPLNLVVGGLPVAVPAHPLVDFSRQGNPHITVTMQVTTLHTFFARIWGNTTATVKASATAEAYNPANVQNFTPIAPKAVKPWLVANVDPNRPPLPPTPFITTATGVVEPNVIGETLNLTADCVSTGPGCALLPAGNPPGIGPANSYTLPSYPQVEYVPALVTAPASPNPNVCPTICLGATSYEQSIECADVTTSYTVLSCGGGATNAQWDNSVNPSGLTGLSALGAECLIHATTHGNSKGQDKLDNLGPWPTSPMQITAQSGPQNGNLVTTSDSIVTIPIIDQTSFEATSPFQVTVVGFLQAFINEVHGGIPAHQGDISVTVLNIVGCSNSSTNSGATPVVGGSGTSPIPVRLITPP